MTTEEINKIIIYLETNAIIEKSEEVKKINLLICKKLIHNEILKKYFKNYNVKIIDTTKVINNNEGINILISDVNDFNNLDFMNNRNIYPILVKNNEVLFGPLISIDGGPCIECLKNYISKYNYINIINSEDLSILLIFIIESIIEKIQKKQPFLSFDHQVKLNVDDITIEKNFIIKRPNCESCDIYV